MDAMVADQQIISEGERDARVQLAALYRLVEYHGWGEGIYNHIALRVPGEPDKFLIKAHAVRYDEVTASNLVKVDCHDDVDESLGVNAVGFNTHAPIMRERRDVDCSLHIHTIPIMAISAMRDGLKMLNVQSTIFFDDVAYADFEGAVEKPDAQQQLVDALGARKVLLLRNHGAVITAPNAPAAYVNLKRFIVSCELQMQLMATGADLVEIEPAMAREGQEIFRRHDNGRGDADWPSWLRMLDRKDPGYRH